MRGVSVSMLVNGLHVRKIRHAGKTYLPVCNGDIFTIEIKNDTSETICAIVSVDGLSIMNGEPASHNDTGYVIRPYSSVNIRGFRRGLDRSKDFVVTTESGDSYTERRTGSGANKGVIGVVIKPEKRRHYRPRRHNNILLADRERSYDKTKTCGLVDNCDYEREVLTSGGIDYQSRGGEEFTSGGPIMRSFCDISECRSKGIISGQRCNTSPAGTKMGQEKYDRVVKVDFEPDDNRKSVIKLYYDTVEGLRRKGVPIDGNEPNPFPGEPDNLYCPDA